MGDFMDYGFNGKVAFVTGGSRGIGRSICEVLEAEGAKVIAPSRSELDLSDSESIRNYISNNETKCDIFIHSAGINELAGINDINEEIIHRVFQVNYTSALMLIKAFAGYMKDNKWGRILLVSSLYSIVSREERIAYSSSKNALNGLCKTLALELAPFNILINEVAPGYVMTDMTRKNLSDEDIVEISKKIPTGRFQESEEIANAAAFLCSDKNRSITGQNLAVDGGFLCR